MLLLLPEDVVVVAISFLCPPELLCTESVCSYLLSLREKKQLLDEVWAASQLLNSARSMWLSPFLGDDFSPRLLYQRLFQLDLDASACTKSRYVEPVIQFSPSQVCINPDNVGFLLELSQVVDGKEQKAIFRTKHVLGNGCRVRTRAQSHEEASRFDDMADEVVVIAGSDVGPVQGQWPAERNCCAWPVGLMSVRLYCVDSQQRKIAVFTHFVNRGQVLDCISGEGDPSTTAMEVWYQKCNLANGQNAIFKLNCDYDFTETGRRPFGKVVGEVECFNLRVRLCDFDIDNDWDYNDEPEGIDLDLKANRKLVMSAITGNASVKWH